MAALYPHPPSLRLSGPRDIPTATAAAAAAAAAAALQPTRLLRCEVKSSTPPGSPTTPSSGVSEIATPHGGSAGGGGGGVVYLPNVGQAGVASDANARYRPSNEDTHVLVPELFATTPADSPGSSIDTASSDSFHSSNTSSSSLSAFLAVYDGHGGAAVADAAADSLHLKFARSLSSSLPSSGCGSTTCCPAVTAPADAFIAAYAELDAELRAARMFQTGATAVTVYFHADPAEPGRRLLTTANVGDARAVLCRAGRPLRLSVDHRAGDEAERQRIEGAGGFVCAKRVNGVLEVSRALGDHSLKSVVVCAPSLRETVLCEADEFLILACDGLWDWIDDEAAVALGSDAFDNGCSPPEVAQALVDASLAAGCTDNISVIVARFDQL